MVDLGPTAAGALDKLMARLRGKTGLVQVNDVGEARRPDHDCQEAADWLEALAEAARRAQLWIGGFQWARASPAPGDDAAAAEAWRLVSDLRSALSGRPFIEQWLPVVGTVWRHNVRGSFYVELGRAVLACPNPIIEGDLLIVQLGPDGLLCAQPDQMMRHRRYLRAQVQSATPLETGVLLVVYLAANGLVWCRPESEFQDGRFTRESTLS